MDIYGEIFGCEWGNLDNETTSAGGETRLGL